MNRTELYNLSGKGTVEIGGVSCIVDIHQDKDGDEFIDIIVDSFSPLHDKAHFGGKWWKYVTDEECLELPEALQQYKQKADQFFSDAQREVKAHFNENKHIVIDDMPDDVKADWKELENHYPGITKRFIRYTHPVTFVNKEKKEWFALGNFTLNIDGNKYIPRWSFWLDRAYYRTDDYIERIFGGKNEQNRI